MITLDINKLILDTRHFREYDHFIRLKLIKSIKKYGQIVPLIVQQVGEYYMILDGNLRLNIFKELGFNSIFCVVVDQELTDIELLDLKLKLNTYSDTNILQLAEVINEYGKLYNPTQISEATDLELAKVLILKDILKVKEYQTEKENVNQSKLF